MQTVVANQSDEHIGKRRGRQDIREVSPRKRRHVTGEEGEQEKDSHCYPGVEDGQQQTGKVVEGNAAEIFHATSQQGITRSAEYGDSRQDEVFAKRHLGSDSVSVERRASPPGWMTAGWTGRPSLHLGLGWFRGRRFSLAVFLDPLVALR